MYPRAKLLLLCLLMIGSLPLDAQFNRLKQKLQDKLEQKLEQKVDEKIDDALDEALEEDEEDEEGSSERQGKKKKIDWENIGRNSVDLTERYQFDTQVDWLVSSAEKEEPMRIAQLLSSAGDYFAMSVKDAKGESTQGTMIFDAPKEQLIIIPESGQQAMLTSLDSGEELSEETDDVTTPTVSVTATGKQKNILGYPCQQYLFASADANGEMWITEALDLANFDLFTSMSRMTRAKNQVHPLGFQNREKGFVLEMKTIDAEGQQSKMEAVGIQENMQVEYDMQTYETLNMTGLPGGMMGN